MALRGQRAESLCRGVVGLGGGVDHQVQLQNTGVQQHLIHGEHLLHRHAVLDGGDAVGGVLLLGPGIGGQQLVRRGGGQLLQIGEEGVLLQISCKASILYPNFPSRWYRGFRGDPQGGQGGGVHQPHVPRLVVDHQRVSGGHGVQLLQGRVCQTGHSVVVIVPGGHPGAGGGGGLRKETADPLCDLLHGTGPLQRDLETGGGHLGEVAVWVDEAGQQGGPFQIHPSVGVHGLQPVQTARGQNVSTLHQHRLDVQRVGHGKDGAAEIKSFHLKSPHCSSGPAIGRRPGHRMGNDGCQTAY